MSDTTNGDDGKGRGRKPGGKSGPGGDKGRERGGPPRGDRPKGGEAGKRPFRPRTERQADAPRPDRPKVERPRVSRPAGEGGKPFAPKSRGMFSHGGARDESGEGGKPRSYGRLQHDGPKGDRKERPSGDRRPPRDDRPRSAPRDDRPARSEVESATTGSMRIAKRLARAGIASRRDAEGMIADGRVKVNGKLLDSPALIVTSSDRIEIDNAPLPAIERTRLWLFHKAAGTVTTNRDPEGRPTIFDRLPHDMPRVLTVGRLDINTEGLLLLTNDGGLARILELPATGWLRRYRVRAHGSINQARLDELRQGIAIDGVFYGAIEATMDREQGSNVWLTLGLREGKNREVKKVLSHLGLEVNRLIRLSFGPFQLGDLKEGAVQEIKGRMLRDQLGDRLIEESGADFDAPVARPFSNRPVEAERESMSERPKKSGEWISASETAPNKKRVREAKREDALGRLDTRAGRPERSDRGERKAYGDRPPKRFEGPKKPYGAREGAGRDDADSPPKRPIDAPKRGANVWMAPGARPQGTKKALGAQAGRSERGMSRSERPSGPRSAPGKPATGRPPRSGGDAPQRGGRPPRPPRKG
ncbi:pseudouridine synthase [Aurantimonas sp. A2-1-M11]|uniref:pseudouridine synthase n=1 Tax=Aurantimonas sp. A2-1-M11 TaxID=3113712 RepID=UPI002F93103C